MLNRREVVLATAAVAALPAGVGAQSPDPDAALNALFDTFFQEDLRRRPEFATQLGLDTGANADLRARLSDESLAGVGAARALNASQLRRLGAIDRGALSTAGKVNYDTVVYARRSQAGVMAFNFGGSSYGPSPYVVGQLTGAYQSTPPPSTPTRWGRPWIARSPRPAACAAGPATTPACGVSRTARGFGVLPAPGARRIAAGPGLFQPPRHRRMAQMGAADHRLSRGTARPSAGCRAAGCRWMSSTG